MSLDVRAQWHVDRCKAGGIARGVDPVLVNSCDDEYLSGLLAMATEQHGKHDPFDLASVIDWPNVKRTGEGHADYMARVHGAVEPLPPDSCGEPCV